MCHLHLRLSRNFSSRSIILTTSSLAVEKKAQLLLVWLGYHHTEKLLMEEGRGVGEKAVVSATLSPHIWQLELR